MQNIDELEYTGSISVLKELVQIVKVQQGQIEVLQLGMKDNNDTIEKLLGVLSGETLMRRCVDEITEQTRLKYLIREAVFCCRTDIAWHIHYSEEAKMAIANLHREMDKLFFPESEEE